MLCFSTTRLGCTEVVQTYRGVEQLLKFDFDVPRLSTSLYNTRITTAPRIIESHSTERPLSLCNLAFSCIPTLEYFGMCTKRFHRYGIPILLVCGACWTVYRELKINGPGWWLIYVARSSLSQRCPETRVYIISELFRNSQCDQEGDYFAAIFLDELLELLIDLKNQGDCIKLMR